MLGKKTMVSEREIEAAACVLAMDTPSYFADENVKAATFPNALARQVAKQMLEAAARARSRHDPMNESITQ